jgi:hypothetical protein
MIAPLLADSNAIYALNAQMFAKSGDPAQTRTAWMRR